MADNSIVKIGLFAAGGYLLYKYVLPMFSTPVAPSPSQTSTSAASTTGSTSASTPASTPVTPTAPAFNSLDAIFLRLQKAVGSAPYNVDQFNYYLQQELPAGKTLPGPESFMPADFDRTQAMTLSQYWGAIAPWLKSNFGLSGLGVFGGLGQLARARR